MLRVPKPLTPGDTIALIAPAKHVNQAGLAAGIAAIEQRGYQVRTTAHLLEKHGMFSAADSIRAADLENAWFSDAAAVICAQGGYGSLRLLPLIDWERLAQTPKWFIGYSDITALHCALNRHMLPTVHGPIGSQLGRTSDGGHGFASLFSILEGAAQAIVRATGEQLTQVISGKAAGRLVGGNLSLLCATLGTPYEVDTSGAVLLFEDVEEEPYRLDRMLTQLALAGKLEQANGFAVGTFSDCNPSDWAPTVTAFDVVVSHLRVYGKPAVYGLPIGHGTYNTAVVLGSQAILDADAGTLAFGLEH